jgi:hypothetical protein
MRMPLHCCIYFSALPSTTPQMKFPFLVCKLSIGGLLLSAIFLLQLDVGVSWKKPLIYTKFFCMLESFRHKLHYNTLHNLQQIHYQARQLSRYDLTETLAYDLSSPFLQRPNSTWFIHPFDPFLPSNIPPIPPMTSTSVHIVCSMVPPPTSWRNQLAEPTVRYIP